MKNTFSLNFLKQLIIFPFFSYLFVDHVGFHLQPTPTCLELKRFVGVGVGAARNM
jgi:hypothetical protein